MVGYIAAVIVIKGNMVLFGSVCSFGFGLFVVWLRLIKGWSSWRDKVEIVPELRNVSCLFFWFGVPDGSRVEGKMILILTDHGLNKQIPSKLTVSSLSNKYRKN